MSTIRVTLGSNARSVLLSCLVHPNFFDRDERMTNSTGTGRSTFDRRVSESTSRPLVICVNPHFLVTAFLSHVTPSHLRHSLSVEMQPPPLASPSGTSTVLVYTSLIRDSGLRLSRRLVRRLQLCRNCSQPCDLKRRRCDSLLDELAGQRERCLTEKTARTASASRQSRRPYQDLPGQAGVLWNCDARPE